MGSSVWSHASPSERQTEWRLQARKGSRAPGGQGCRPSPVPGRGLPIFPIGSLGVKTSRSSRPYLHRSAGCRAGGSRFCRSTGSCQCCFYTSAGRGSRGTRRCLEGNRQGRSSFVLGAVELHGPLVSLIDTSCPIQAVGGHLTPAFLPAHKQRVNSEVLPGPAFSAPPLPYPSLGHLCLQSGEEPQPHAWPCPSLSLPLHSLHHVPAHGHL